MGDTYVFLICGPAGRAASFFAEARFVPPLRGGTFLPPRRRRGLLFACAKRSKSTPAPRGWTPSFTAGVFCFARVLRSLRPEPGFSPCIGRSVCFRMLSAVPAVPLRVLPGCGGGFLPRVGPARQIVDGNLIQVRQGLKNLHRSPFLRQLFPACRPSLRGENPPRRVPPASTPKPPASASRSSPGTSGKSPDSYSASPGPYGPGG